jgi:hypothetical protein
MKYTNFKKAVVRSNHVMPVTVKGKMVKVEGSSYKFFQEKGSEILTNVETGILTGKMEQVNDTISFVNIEIRRALEFFGNINDIPDNGKTFPSWYSMFAVEFKTIFGFSMPVDVCGLDVIKLDSLLRTPNGTSTREFIMQKFGEQALALVETIMRNHPYMVYFYNEKQES